MEILARAIKEQKEHRHWKGRIQNIRVYVYHNFAHGKTYSRKRWKLKGQFSKVAECKLAYMDSSIFLHSNSEEEGKSDFIYGSYRTLNTEQ